ncbi:hypothetical protein GCM10025782_01330 [Pedococcus ginsenosidimutans]|uniref:Uncharacterized protein n=1 Tax=Pedococcus ginsenosidimutans TaxID=490570 RepID=A0ABP8XL51_9MICO
MISAAISAVVGAGVSLLAVSQTTIRQRRAESRDDARLELRRVLQPMRAKVRKYRARMLSGMKRDAHRIEGDDYVLASAVLAAADGLHPVRRWLVLRRARRVFGPFMVAVADLSPTQGDTLGSIAPLLMAQHDPSKLGLADDELRLGLLHEALVCDPGSEQVRRLERELTRLASGW